MNSYDRIFNNITEAEIKKTKAKTRKALTPAQRRQVGKKTGVRPGPPPPVEESLTPEEVVRRAVAAKGGQKGVLNAWRRRTFAGKNRKPNPENQQKAQLRTNAPGGKSFETRKKNRDSEVETKKESRELQLRRAAQGDIAAVDDGPPEIKG